MKCEIPQVASYYFKINKLESFTHYKDKIKQISNADVDGKGKKTQ